MDFWYNIQSHKWDLAGWLLLFTFSLFLLFINRKNQRQGVRKLCLFMVLSLLLYYNHFFASEMLKTHFPSFAEYERLSWLFFTREIIAFVVVIISGKIDKEKRKTIIICLLAFCLFISNAHLFIYGFQKPSNLYKVSDDIIEIGDALVAHMGDKRPRVLIQSDAYDENRGDEMYHGIRQYTSVPILAVFYVSPEKYDAKEFELSDYGVMNYEYLICHNESALKRQAESLSFNLIHKTKNYCLFKNTKEFTLFFVRHGQTDANVEGRFAGSGTDAMLTEEGINQAKTTGMALADISFSNVYTSELTRTINTADLILSENHNEVPKTQVLTSLDDFYWGELENMTVAEIQERYPDFELDAYIGTADDDSYVSPVGAWTKHYIVNHMKEALYETSALAQNGGNTLVVGHSAMVWYLQSAFPNQVKDTDGINNASITILHYNSGIWTLEELNLSAEEYEKRGL